MDATILSFRCMYAKTEIKTGVLGLRVLMRLFQIGHHIKNISASVAELKIQEEL